MNLNPPNSRAQHSNSTPNAFPLRAATLSFVTTPTPPTQDPSNHNATQKGYFTTSSAIEKVNTGGDGRTPVIQQNKLKNKIQENCYRPSGSKHHLLQDSSSMVGFATQMAKVDFKVGKRADNNPTIITVNTCRRSPRDDVAAEEYSLALPVDTPPKHSRLPNISPQGVDSTLLEDISSLKDLFEKGISQQPTTEVVPFPAIYTPKSIGPISKNPSLTAAILATQLSASNSILKDSSKPAQRISPRLNFDNRPSSHGTAPELSPFLLESKHSGLLETSGSSDREGALLAATLAVKPKSPQNPPKKSMPPKPPPPRKAYDSLIVPNIKTLEIEDNPEALSVGSVKTVNSKFDLARSSILLQPFPSYSKRGLSLGNISNQTEGYKSFAMVSTSTISTAPPNTSPIQPLSSQPSTGDSTLATTLAPSRVNLPGPRKPPAPPAPRRSRRKSLPPYPTTGFRETIRKPRSSPVKASPKLPKLIKHHPHKYLEGRRRCWRHFITDAERKRYEGLWASNKGLLVTCSSKLKSPPPSPLNLQKSTSHEPRNYRLQHVWSSTPGFAEDLSDCVGSLITRDIWTRSRLPLNHLADIWDLVDRGNKGRLSRDEFVVGTWLIDQSLKGRKLPLNVQDQVWQSVRSLGIKVPPPGCSGTTYNGKY